MLVMLSFPSRALMLSLALQVLHGGLLGATTTDDAMKPHHASGPAEVEYTLPPGATVSHLVPQSSPCLLDDIFAVMRDDLEDELTNSSLTLFGICKASETSSGSVLLDLAKKTKQRTTLEVLHPTGVMLVEDEARGELELTFDLPQQPLLKLPPVLLLTFESPVTGGDLDEVTFSSLSLQPKTQAVCISEGTQYVFLTGKASEVQQRWRISVETTTADMRRTVKELLISTNSRVSMSPFLLFSEETGTDTSTKVFSSSLYFFCELRRFLRDVLPQDQPESTPLKLDSLQSLPPLTLGLSSSEVMLAGLINSSAPTIFSFSSSVFDVHQGELALSPALLEELRQRLVTTVMQIMEALREEEGHRGMKRLERLKELTSFPQLASGESQYHAFLLLKALNTVGREIKRQPRATRAEPTSPARGSICGLRSLTVSLESHLVSPNTANINNCHGSCVFPLVNTKNHAVLLHSHIQSGNVQERGPCCVPVAYESLEVVDLNQDGTFISIQPDVVAQECGCR
ncbi:muellerian-inhibiting factor [Aulostomus maculatus]